MSGSVMRKAVVVGMAVVLVAVFVWANRPSPQPSLADFVLVEKHAHRMTVYYRGAITARYRVALGHGGLEGKRQDGDGRTPEGRYTIDRRLPHSAFHKALHISYPSSADLTAAHAAHVAPGGDIMIHGLRNGFGWIGRLHRLIDWTNGCIALSDSEMDALWTAVPDGTPIEIHR
jgi:murein L,D-transpeptidase YafK